MIQVQKRITTFGQWVKQRRKELCLTQAELGQLVSCSSVMINKIEGDQRRPSIQVARLLAGHLKIAPNDRNAFISLARPDLPAEQLDDAQPFDRLSVNRRPTNIPAPLTPLIGRAQEATAVCALLLHPDVRLVTLTGPGGVGKTRLGLQVARDLNEQFADGSWFISLANVQDPDLVIPTIARSLGIKEARDRSIKEALLHYLADKDALLLLDNFEQVSAAAKQIAEMLVLASAVKVLVTSRTVLHISGEYEFVVPPLRFVDLRNSLPGEDLTDSPAVRLFAQRARTVNSAFALTPQNADAVARICARLDGLPLAIELAASRIKFLSPAALFTRLEGSSPDDGPLNVLAGGAQDLPVRQQTMRQTIDWSYNLLNQEEQDLFRRLAVFVGGCTLEAAAAVCGGVTTELHEIPTRAFHILSDRLASLIDQSMLRQLETSDDARRFAMIETLREYALERLAARSKEWTMLRQKHARYYMELAEAGEKKFEGPEQEVWLEQLEAEHDNLLAALAWSCSPEGEPEIGLRLAAAIWQFWMIRGYINEGLAWLPRLLACADSASKLYRARALNGAGFLHWAWSDFPQAKILLHQALVLFRQLGNRHGTAWVLNHLGHVALAEHELELAAGMVQESLTIFLALHADWNVAWDLLNMGDIVLAQGREAQAIPYYTKSLELFRKVGDHRGMAWSLDHLGRLAHAHRNHAHAKTLFSESLELFRKLGDKWSTAWVLNHLGSVALAQGDFEQAQIFVEESLSLFQEVSLVSNGVGTTIDLGWATLSLGDAARQLGDEARAETLFSKSLKLFREVADQRGTDEALRRLIGLEHMEEALSLGD